MEYMDEKIVEVMSDRQKDKARHETKSHTDDSAQQQTPQRIIKIKGDILAFEEKSLLENKISVPLPKTFSLMPPEMAAVKYASEKRPTVIYGNENFSITIAFNHTESALREEDMETFTNDMIQILKRTQPLARWLEQGVRNVREKRIGFCEFIVPVWDDTLYNLFFFAELDERVLLCTFNCPEEERKDWRPIARGIMDSLTLHANEKGEEKR
ncbi:hypothetical protein [Aneurinibacillus uraniidurans]|uniref:hypothetical protein n=1 Tax=Aneurinibacillus uraniidurans TaxID=2966586 RepID=UPI00234A475E|nr:hypothetical protein [Aneurinibacillus sp. B1]WCN36419.1 hypothetical protein PO771_11020 [Aneurinibacillus sp. B1]